MKLLRILVPLLLISGSLYADEPDSTSASADSLLSPERIKSFYIGFSHYSGQQELITLNITEVDTSEEVPAFIYTMNSLNDIKQGKGHYNQQERWIELENQDRASVSVSDSGHVVLESFKKDSLNYWKMEEN